MAKKKAHLSVTKRKRGHIVRREKAKEAKAIEPPKRALLIRGRKSGEVGLELLRDIKKLRGTDYTTLFSRKNELLPFDQEEKLEFLCGKNDAGLFAFCSHSKKRPNNFVLGRIYDNQVFDIIELGLSNFESIQDVLKKTKISKAVGGQSCIIFQGDEFEKDAKMQSLKNVLFDLFKAPQRDQIDMSAIDHAIVCTASEGKVYIRNYVVVYKGKNDGKSVQSIDVEGQRIPDVALINMGPNVDMTIRRTRLPTTEISKLAMKQPKLVSGQPKKIKNVTHDELEGKIGRIHMKKQDLNSSKLVMRTRFKRALTRNNNGEAADAQTAQKE